MTSCQRPRDRTSFPKGKQSRTESFKMTEQGAHSLVLSPCQVSFKVPTPALPPLCTSKLMFLIVDSLTNYQKHLTSAKHWVSVSTNRYITDKFVLTVCPLLKILKEGMLFCLTLNPLSLPQCLADSRVLRNYVAEDNVCQSALEGL